MSNLSYETLKVRFDESVCYIQLHRPKANNTINRRMLEEFNQVLLMCEESVTVIVLEGSAEVFCFGADFKEIYDNRADKRQNEQNPGNMYDIWLKLATGPYVTISHVQGRVNAGGMGFVAASDIVIADETAQFSLSELLFGVFPACVLPFLIQRIGFQKAHYMTLMTHPVGIEKAHLWGLVDAYDAQSQMLLRKHLLRLRYLSKNSISRYKTYTESLRSFLPEQKSIAVEANIEAFSDPRNQQGIYRYIETGKFPWEH